RRHRRLPGGPLETSEVAAHDGVTGTVGSAPHGGDPLASPSRVRRRAPRSSVRIENHLNHLTEFSTFAAPWRSVVADHERNVAVGGQQPKDHGAPPQRM